MSVANIDILSDSNKIEYSIGLFYSDLQALINHNYNTLIDFEKEVSMTSIEQRAILDYINSNFSLSDIDSVSLSKDFFYWKIEDEMIWLFFCAKLPKECKTLIIKNTIFLDLYNDQINYTLIKEGEKEEGMEFNKRKINLHYSI